MASLLQIQQQTGALATPAKATLAFLSDAPAYEGQTIIFYPGENDEIAIYRGYGSSWVCQLSRRVGNSSPIGSIVPRCIGEYYIAKISSDVRIFIATGATNSDWSQLS